MNRAASPVVGTVLLAGVVVVLATVVGAATIDVVSPPEPVDPVVISASATDDGRVALVHEAGSELDVGALTLRLAVDGAPLDHQPPVPFFSATGFKSANTGPFNPSADQTWEPGERATLVVASTTNAPSLERGVTLTVELYRGDTPLAAVETTVDGAGA